MLALPLAAAAQRTRAAAGLRLSVRVEPLFPGLLLSQQITKVAEAQYHGFEFGDFSALDYFNGIGHPVFPDRVAPGNPDGNFDAVTDRVTGNVPVELMNISIE